MSEPRKPTEDRETPDASPKVTIKGIGDPVSHDLSLARGARSRKDEEGGATRKLDLKLFRRLFSWSRHYGPKRYWLFALVFLRSVQLPLLAWTLGAIINGPIARNDFGGTILAATGFTLLALSTQFAMHFRQRFSLELGEVVVF